MKSGMTCINYSGDRQPSGTQGSIGLFLLRILFPRLLPFRMFTTCMRNVDYRIHTCF